MDELKFKAMSNYVIVSIEERELKMGNIIIPDSVKSVKMFDTKVVCISEELDENGKPLVKTVKVGDRVVFDMGAGGMPINLYSKRYMAVRETELVGIVTATDEEMDAMIKENLNKQAEEKPKIVKLRETLPN